MIAGDGVRTLSHQFGYQQSRAHFFQQVGLRFVRMVQIQVVRAAMLPVVCIPSLRAL